MAALTSGAPDSRPHLAADAVVALWIDDATLQHDARSQRPIGLAAHLLDERHEPVLRRPNPLRPEIDPRAVRSLERQRAPAYAVARFQHDHIGARLPHPVGGREPGEACANHAGIRGDPVVALRLAPSRDARSDQD
jgi:hypothetical protein